MGLRRKIFREVDLKVLCNADKVLEKSMIGNDILRHPEQAIVLSASKKNTKFVNNLLAIGAEH